MSSNVEYTSLFSLPIASLQYRDIASVSFDAEEPHFMADDRGSDKERRRRAEVELSEAEFAERIRRERAEATQIVEQKLRQEYEHKLVAARAPIPAAIREFAEQRTDYFTRVEAEVVQLALAIAAKILHREAQVDPMLVAAVVRIAVEKMRDDSSVKVHVAKGRGNAWRQHCSSTASLAKLEVIEDPELSEHDCLVETELGIANFGVDTQLKEIEQGFFDLMALRPPSR